MKSPVDLYLNADKTKVVLESDLAAASLLVNAGREIPDAEVSAMGAGLLEQAQAFTEGAMEEKQVKGPPEDKSVGKKDEKSTPAPEPTNFTRMNRDELDAYAAEHNVDITGAANKGEVIERIEAASKPQE